MQSIVLKLCELELYTSLSVCNIYYKIKNRGVYVWYSFLLMLSVCVCVYEASFRQLALESQQSVPLNCNKVRHELHLY